MSVCDNCRRAAAASDGRTEHGIEIGACYCATLPTRREEHLSACAALAISPVLTEDERQSVEEREALWKALGYPEKLFEIAAALTSAERRGFRRGVDAAAKWLKLTEPLGLAMLRRLGSGDES